MIVDSTNGTVEPVDIHLPVLITDIFMPDLLRLAQEHPLVEPGILLRLQDRYLSDIAERFPALDELAALRRQADEATLKATDHDLRPSLRRQAREQVMDEFVAGGGTSLVTLADYTAYAVRYYHTLSSTLLTDLSQHIAHWQMTLTAGDDVPVEAAAKAAWRGLSRTAVARQKLMNLRAFSGVPALDLATQGVVAQLKNLLASAPCWGAEFSRLLDLMTLNPGRFFTVAKSTGSPGLADPMAYGASAREERRA